MEILRVEPMITTSKLQNAEKCSLCSTPSWPRATRGAAAFPRSTEHAARVGWTAGARGVGRAGGRSSQSGSDGRQERGQRAGAAEAESARGLGSVGRIPKMGRKEPKSHCRFLVHEGQGAGVVTADDSEILERRSLSQKYPHFLISLQFDRPVSLPP